MMRERLPIIARNTGQSINVLLSRSNNTQRGIIGQTDKVIIMAFHPGISGNPAGRPHQKAAPESKAVESYGRGLSNG